MTHNPPTTDQLRDDIDRGRTGEKVNFPDPATVPLGTDAEAAGYPPSKAERQMAAPAEKRPAPRATISPVLVFIGSTVLLGIVMIAVMYL